ncbi:hypothetical protein [Orenia marismortui]|uniref:Uncharacterized protein n=1 Tax=Orenia marismortui TaxID=46469 RepID=A0A4R8GXT2_9FIRM|nr:hypothetical protein [Orenia marismortui]TDX51130.1 hypothetical protein C7959_1156 [Orenia marismortui]
MNKQIIILKKLKEFGLHDSLLKFIKIDYENDKITLNICTFPKTERKEFLIELEGIKLLIIEKEDDFKNEEIILNFDVDIVKNKMNIFTTSNTRYRIIYKQSKVYLVNDTVELN